MKIYLRKVFPHDVTHEVSVTTEIVKEFFDNAKSMKFTGIESMHVGNVTINNATDPRFGGDYKAIIASEGGIEEDDLIITYKYSGTYEVRVIKKSNRDYATFFSLFKGKERHVIFMTDDESKGDDTSRVEGGANVLYYGVPGAGKSHEIDKIAVKERTERVVFHPDYSYSDFIGQILPRLVKDENDPEAEPRLKYVFSPGPFTKMIFKAKEDPSHMYYLVIEEINRGNAPAIFGDVFQLLDRNDDGSGKYSISNYDIATYVFGNEEEEVIMPSNLTLFATMNTSDQNVFTLDTAFQRRWDMKLVKNDISNAEHANALIEGSDITWGRFAQITNNEILKYGEETGSSEDKRLGAYFIKADGLTREKFPEKVIKYLWDDAFKMDRQAYFSDGYTCLDDIVEVFRGSGSNVDVMKTILDHKVYAQMVDTEEKQTTESEGSEE